MISYEQVMEFTSGVSAPAAFEDPCCRLMYDTVASLPPHSAIIEVGVEYGRSTSILAQVAKDQKHALVLVDPFVDPLSVSSAMEMLSRVGLPFLLFKMTTRQANSMGLAPAPGISLLHIDGSHTQEDLTYDCELLLPSVIPGGYACFHDYGRDSLPDVYLVVNSYMTPDKWECIRVANTLGVWRRK